jgi:hypothetical protein
VIAAELGCDMTRFPTAGHAASWAGLCPGNHESAGKRLSGRTRFANRTLRAALVESARGAIANATRTSRRSTGGSSSGAGTRRASSPSPSTRGERRQDPNRTARTGRLPALVTAAATTQAITCSVNESVTSSMPRPPTGGFHSPLTEICARVSVASPSISRRQVESSVRMARPA